MQRLMTGSEYHNMQFYNSLVKCLNDTDPILYESVNAQWEKFRGYAETGGNRPEKDPWYSCEEDEISPEVRIILQPSL